MSCLLESISSTRKCSTSRQLTSQTTEKTAIKPIHGLAEEPKQETASQGNGSSMEPWHRLQSVGFMESFATLQRLDLDGQMLFLISMQCPRQNESLRTLSSDRSASCFETDMVAVFEIRCCCCRVMSASSSCAMKTVQVGVCYDMYTSISGN